MRRTIRLVTLVMMLVAFAIPALAQNKDCTDENKAAWYKTFLENYKGDANQQKTAYDTGKIYITACTDDPADAPQQFVKKWVGIYDKATKASQIKAQLDDAYSKKNYADVLSVGKQILADSPDYLKAYILMGYVGNFAGENAALATESATYAKKGIDLVAAGKKPENWPNFSQDEVLAWLNRSIGMASLKGSPEDAIPYLLKTLHYDSSPKKDPYTYYYLAAAYENGPYAKQSADYKKYAGQAESNEQKLALANINQTVDRMIDAYARAVALAGNDPKLASDKSGWMQSLTDWYKFRHDKSDAGLNDLIATVLQKPLPDVPTPITTLPTPVATPTGSSSSVANGSTTTTGRSAGGAGAPTGKPATQTGGKPATAKPSPTPGTRP